MFAARFEYWEGNVTKAATAFLLNKTIEIVIGIFDIVWIFSIGL
jgi:hypothetical protein